MTWIRVLSDFDWKPRQPVTIAFRTGDVRKVTRDCAAKAIAAGKAEPTKRPPDASGKNASSAALPKAQRGG